MMEPISPSPLSSSYSAPSLSSSYSSSSSILSSGSMGVPSLHSSGGHPGAANASVIYDSKVVLLGCSDVGKSAISIKYVSGYFQKRLTPTIGASFQSKLINMDGKNKIKFMIWDTAGQERFRSLTHMYYRGASVAILVYDITMPHTFETIKSWVNELKQNIQEDIIMVVCGNKLDLQDRRMVKKEVAKAYADEIKAMYCETSAKEGEGIDPMFLEIAKKILNQKNQAIQQQLLLQQQAAKYKLNLLKKSGNSSNNLLQQQQYNRNSINGGVDDSETNLNSQSSQCCS